MVHLVQALQHDNAIGTALQKLGQGGLQSASVIGELASLQTAMQLQAPKLQVDKRRGLHHFAARKGMLVRGKCRCG